MNKKTTAATKQPRTLLAEKRDYEAELITAINKLKKSDEWIANFFDLIKALFIELNVEEDSEKITMSVTKNSEISISFGQRWIIKPSKRNNFLGLIMPLGFREISADYPTSFINDDYFFDKQHNQEALWVLFESADIFLDNNFLFDQWKQVAEVELQKTQRSGFRRSHNPYFYKMVMDEEYRKKVLGIC